MIVLRALGPQKSISHGSQGPTSTSPTMHEDATRGTTSSLPSGSTGMGDSQVPTSSLAREASTRGSAPEGGDGPTNTPECPIRHSTPDYWRTGTGRLPTQQDASRNCNGDLT
ncbi:hypothetical protein M758_UG143800 [Ceratodon purpureus]|nr:hypothetical protein M758_UG143800 [Ceratodon purpureus]